MILVVRIKTPTVSLLFSLIVMPIIEITLKRQLLFQSLCASDKCWDNRDNRNFGPEVQMTEFPPERHATASGGDDPRKRAVRAYASASFR